MELSIIASGIKFTGNFSANKVAYFFEIHNAVNTVNGEEFSTLEEVCEHYGMDLSEETISRLAADEAGIPLDAILNMDCRRN